jgi:dihydroflavonol-4-reductase
MVEPWVLVTGASGFIGSRLVKLLVERGERVKAFVRPGSRLDHLQEYPADRVWIVFGDITVEHTVYRALAGCDRMYHVASVFRVGELRPETVLVPAVEGTRATLSAALKRRLRRVVVTSSVAALGTTLRPEPMDEEHEFNHADPEAYIQSKYQAQQVALELIEAGLPAVIVQPTAVAGPGDWKPTPAGQSVLQCLAAPGLVPRVDGGVSVVDVDDVAQGHVLAMERGKVGQCYLLGGENVTYDQYIGLLAQMVGRSASGPRLSPGVVRALGWMLEAKARWLGGEALLTYKVARDMAGHYHWANSDKAERELGYQHRPAVESLERSVRWYHEHGYLSPRTAWRIRVELGTAT